QAERDERRSREKLQKHGGGRAHDGELEHADDANERRDGPERLGELKSQQRDHGTLFWEWFGVGVASLDSLDTVAGDAVNPSWYARSRAQAGAGSIRESRSSEPNTSGHSGRYRSPSRSAPEAP